MKSSSSNSEKSTGISLRVFRGELPYMAADMAEALAAATDAALLLLAAVDVAADTDAALLAFVVLWWC